MKICFVGPANSSHIVKWCNWFLKKGHKVSVISFTPGEIDGVDMHLIDLKVDAGGSDFGKIKYMFTGKQIKKIIDEIKPDIINAHYATSYGVALALSGVKDYVLSVWGADIYDFPKKSPLHKFLLKLSLRKASHLFSTSRAMADEASKYTDKRFEITPFGVDMSLFNPDKRTRGRDEDFIIGTVKALSDKYGIADILKAASIIKKDGNVPVKVRIAGKGPQEDEYRKMAQDLGISDIVTWLGFISQEEAAAEWANMDVAIIPSTLESESFGVSAVEAEACGTAVVISDIPGLMEATKPGKSSVVVKRNNYEEIARAVEKLYFDEDLRNSLASEGLNYAGENYELNYCFSNIEKIFSDLLGRESK